MICLLMLCSVGHDTFEQRKTSVSFNGHLRHAFSEEQDKDWKLGLLACPHLPNDKKSHKDTREHSTVVMDATEETKSILDLLNPTTVGANTDRKVLFSLISSIIGLNPLQGSSTYSFLTGTYFILGFGSLTEKKFRAIQTTAIVLTIVIATQYPDKYAMIEK